MLGEFKILIKLFRENKLKLSLVLGASIVVGLVYNFQYKPTYTAQFEMAPYFEIASDLGNELHQISNAINQQDSVYIKNKLGDGYKLNHNIIKSSNYSKNDKGSDYSFKHKNLKLSIETNDTNKQELALWNKALVDFCNNYVADSIRTYRGISVYEEKLKILSESQFLKNEKDSMFNFYKSDYQKNNIILSDAMINKIVYAQTLGEYKSAFENNYYSQLGKSIQLKQRLYSSLESFVLITIVPVLLFIGLIRLIKYES